MIVYTDGITVFSEEPATMIDCSYRDSANYTCTYVHYFNGIKHKIYEIRTSADGVEIFRDAWYNTNDGITTYVDGQWSNDLMMEIPAMTEYAKNIDLANEQQFMDYHNYCINFGRILLDLLHKGIQSNIKRTSSN